MRSPFPHDFFWGAAAAAYQVEGGIENTDWAAAAREGKVPACGRACEHYTRYEADFDIARSLGHNSHRLSVEWARIEPEEGKFDEAAVEHYRAVVRALRARNLEPFITLWHFTLPEWFVAKGGFEHPDSPQLFARYCAYVALQLGNECTHFATINEPTVYVSNGWRRGTWPPFKKWPGIDRIAIPGYRNEQHAAAGNVSNIFHYFSVLRRLARAHGAAYQLMKRENPALDVSFVHHVVLFHANRNPFNALLAKIMNWHWTHYWMKLTQGAYDSIGVNYYLHKKFGDTRVYEKTDMGWDVYPEGIEAVLCMFARYKKPVMVSEAGVADEKDTMRADYIRALVRGVAAARANGIDVRGFMYWSLLDNYEWASGFEKRFGLVAIDYETMERTVRPSALVYKEIIERNGLLE